MERLTRWDEYGNADVIALSDVMPELYAELSFSETNALTDVLNRLATYEDTGLEPWEVAAQILPHNPPLTLEALREMDRDWVWIERIGKYSEGIKRFINVFGFVLASERYVQVVEAKFLFDDYGKTWRAYRRKLEEGTV